MKYTLMILGPDPHMLLGLIKPKGVTLLEMRYFTTMKSMATVSIPDYIDPSWLKGFVINDGTFIQSFELVTEEEGSNGEL